MARRFVRYTFAIMLCAVLTTGALYAASFTYSDQAKRIKAGVVLPSLPPPPPLDPRMDPANRPNPYVFYIMDQRQDMKPAGWEFYNPYASSHVTTDMAARWGGMCAVGDVIDKSMGCYWEVPIGEVNPDDLAQYDVLFLSGYGNMTFNGREKEKLRKFVDNGGVLWVDYQQKPGYPGLQTTLDPTFFVPSIAFSNGGVGMSVRADIPKAASAHALLNRPFLVSGMDANLLGGGGGAAPGNEFLSLVGEALQTFMPIVARGGNQVVSAAQYGSGYIVVTADGVAQAITNPVGVAGAVCGKFFIAAQPEDLKLSYNIVNWGSESPAPRKNPRQTGGSFEEIGMPLVPLWSYTATTPGMSVNSSPVILDDMIFYVDGNNVLHAFDLSPIRDRDGDGNPDDGLPDYSTGSPCDELWRVSIGEPCSSPTAAYVPIGGGVVGAVPTVFIVTQSGKVTAYNALDYTTSTGPTPVQLFTDSSQALNPFVFPPTALDTRIPAATYAEGSLYVGDGRGVIHVHNFLSTGAVPEWRHVAIANNPADGMISNSPTVGYFYDATSGATELVAYLNGRGTPTLGANPYTAAYPLSSFNETLVPDNPAATPGLYRIRSVNAYIATTPIAPFDPRLYYTDPTTGALNPIPTTDYTLQNPGKFQIINPSATLTTITALGASVVADYWLDYTNPAATTSWRSIQIWGNDNPLDKLGITGSAAAGKNNTLYYGTENGSIYAVRETGRAGATIGGGPLRTPLVVKWRWCFQDPTVKAVIGTNNVEIVGSPVVVNDMVYFGVNIGNQGFLFAFQADPAFTIRLNQPIAPNTQVILKQMDSLRPTTPVAGVPRNYVAASDTDVDKAAGDTVALVDYDTSKISVINFKGVGGELTSSADLVVEYVPAAAVVPGQTPIPIQEPHYAFLPNSGDNWNNLKWFMRLEDISVNPVMNYKIASSPTVMGDVLYIGCQDGTMIAVDVGKANQAAPKQMLGNVQEKYFKNILTITDGYVWPNQLVAPTNSNPQIWGSPTGSHGMLAVATSDGLSVMYNPTSLVADGNRLVEIDAQGKPIWSCDSTTGFASTFAVGATASQDQTVVGSVTMPFNRPSVARRAPVGGLVVADTGNNRIVHMDKGGTAIWQIKDFGEENPATPVLPPGSPMELNKPTDVTCWMTTMPVTLGASTTPVMLPIYHYLIADNGNNRVLEIVCKYDTALGQYRNMVVMVSDNLAQGEPRRFLTARIATYDNVTGQIATVICVMANDPGSTGARGLGSSLVELDWKTGKLLSVTNRLPIGATAATSFKLVNPSFFNRQYVSGTEYADVTIDASGVHVNHVAGGVSSIRHYLFTDHWDTDETSLMNKLLIQVPGMPVGTTAPHARPFAPSYAQYMPNGHVLVTNKATGIAYDKTKTQRAFTGEVFEIEPEDVTVDPTKTKFKRTPGSSIWYTAGFHQPLSAERLLY